MSFNDKGSIKLNTAKDMEAINLKRHITQKEYSKYTKRKLKKLLQLVRTEISIKPWELNEEEIRENLKNYIAVNDRFYCERYQKRTYPLVIGGFATLAFVIFLFLPEPWDLTGILIRMVPFLIIILCIIYYFTMPIKETILNRLDGTITSTGFLWQPNYTMPFHVVAFVASAPSKNLSPPTLQIVRPNSWFYDNSFAMGGCYEDLSFITWYMDKNRPLPPGTAFDSYRQRDFERRKAEGFPPPLYKSAVPTLEATPEQQKEREKYWKDYEYRPNTSNEDFAIPSI